MEKISTLGFLSLRKVCSLCRGPGPSLDPCVHAAYNSAWLSSACLGSSGGWSRGENRPLCVLRVSRVPCPAGPRASRARAMPASTTIHVLQLLRELLAFVLLSYTVLIGALLLAGWTTYFLVLK